MRFTGGRIRRGVSAIYTIVLMVVFCGLCSFGVDLGRMQLVKTELQGAADAAARAGASAIPNDLPAARARATQFASLQKVDGRAVALDPADIEFGRWNESTRQFEPLSGNLNIDSIRVTARRTAARGNATPLVFASILGVSTCDATASAVARVDLSPVEMNIVGIDYVTMKGGDRIDSYSSAAGPYSPATAGANVNVASNGNMSLGGSSRINGNAWIRESSTVSGTVTGEIKTLDAPLSYPSAKLNGTYTSHGAISLKSGQSLTLTKGRHYCTSLSLSGNAKLDVSGSVKLYVQGAINIDGNSEIATAGSKPGHLEIIVLGSAPIHLGKNNLYASIYAPDSHLYMNGNSNLFGAVVARSITMLGGNTIHFDTDLLSTSGVPGSIKLVK